MVILLSALAVVAAAILLVAWFVVGGGFTLIYAAMALAVVSMVLLWAARWIGSSPAPAGSLAPAPLAEEIRVEVPIRDEVDEEAAVRRPFPIADYEHLWVTQILPLLRELDDDELAVVEARERGARHRGGILDAIDDIRRDRRDPSDLAPPAAEPGAGEIEAEDRADGVDDAEDEAGEARPALVAALATDDPLADVEPLRSAELTDDDDDEAFERAWNRLTAIDDGDELADLDRPARDLSRFGAGIDLTDDAASPEEVAEVEVLAEDDRSEAEPPADARPAPDEPTARRDLVGAGPAGPRVRTFLGRVSAPITVDHGTDDGLP